MKKEVKTYDLDTLHLNKMLAQSPKKKLEIIEGIKVKLHGFLKDKGFDEYTYVVEFHRGITVKIPSGRKGVPSKTVHSLQVKLDVRFKEEVTKTKRAKLKKEKREKEIGRRLRTGIHGVTNVYVLDNADNIIIGAYAYTAVDDVFNELDGELIAMRKLHRRLLGK